MGDPVRLPGDIGEDLMLLLQEMHDIDSGLCAKFADFLCAAAGTKNAPPEPDRK